MTAFPKIGTFLVLMAVASRGLISTVASGSPAEMGLVAYYPFNGDAKDQSGNGNDGIVHGATLTSDRYGTPDAAYQFDGDSAYIEMARPLPDSVSVSFSLWLTAPSAGFTQTIFFEGDATSGF